jgi:putative transcriptional regulator
MAKRERRQRQTSRKVTNENFGQLLIESAAEAVRIHEGRGAPARVHTYPAMTVRDVDVEPPPTPSPADIQALRNRMNVSQDVFARILNVSTFTDRSWEQGQRVPEGAALRLLQIAQEHPKVLTAFVRGRVRRHGKGHGRALTGAAQTRP